MLDDAQRNAVESPGHTLRILAGAGSGKTRVLTHRVAHRVRKGDAQASRTLVLTFTRKAADQLVHRLRTLEVDDITAGTFHGIAYAQLRTYFTNKSLPKIVSPSTIIERLPQKLRGKFPVRAIASEIAWAKNRGITPELYSDVHHKGVLSPRQFMSVYQAYEREKSQRGVIDFDDVLLLTSRALKTDATFADAQRWRFRHFYVDEFQDLNAAQFELLRLWCGDRDDICIVGDPNQAIYGWNGADANYLFRFEEFFPNVTTIDLTRNYRSSSAILHVAHAVQKGTALPPYDGSLLPTIVAYRDEGHEAAAVAHGVREAHRRGFRWTDIAVLYRTNAQREPLDAEMRRLAIPTSTGLSWFQSEQSRRALAFLCENPMDLLSVRYADLQADEDNADVICLELHESIDAFLREYPTATAGQFRSSLEISARFDGPSSHNAVLLTTFHRAKGLEWPVVFLVGLEDGLVPLAGTGKDRLDEERRLLYVAVTRAEHELHLSWAQSRSKRVMQERNPSPWLADIAHAIDGLRHWRAENPREAFLDLRKVLDATKDTDVHPSAASDDPFSPPSAVMPQIADGAKEAHAKETYQARRNTMLRWRASRATLVGVAPALILNDDALDAIVRYAPTTTDALIKVTGMGPVRARSLFSELPAELFRSA